jgi:hypothetical protein
VYADDVPSGYGKQTIRVVAPEVFLDEKGESIEIIERVAVIGCDTRVHECFSIVRDVVKCVTQ